jgi:hypothetical protein
MSTTGVVLLVLTIATWPLLSAVLGSVIGVDATGDRDIFNGLRSILAGVLIVALWGSPSGLLLMAGGQGHHAGMGRSRGGDSHSSLRCVGFRRLVPELRTRGSMADGRRDVGSRADRRIRGVAVPAVAANHRCFSAGERSDLGRGADSVDRPMAFGLAARGGEGRQANRTRKGIRRRAGETERGKTRRESGKTEVHDGRSAFAELVQPARRRERRSDRSLEGIEKGGASAKTTWKMAAITPFKL